MFERLVKRVEARAREAAEAARRKVEAAFEAIPDVRLRLDGDAVVVEANGLARRWISDTRLRFALWGPSTTPDQARGGPPPRTGEDLK